MITVDEARRIIMDNTSLLGTETIDITRSLNRVLAEDIYSEENIPRFNKSAMDGYAVISASLKNASEDHPATLRVVERLPAGYITDRVLEEGITVKIMTGAPVPEGCDAVVPVESTCEEGCVVKIFNSVEQWENVRLSGEDIQKGQVAIHKGILVRPYEIGMFAALNVREVSVIKLPVVSFLSTGDELVDIGDELSPGKIRNINSYSLQAQIEKYECIPVNLGIARDRKEEIRERLEQAGESDILIISGGVSVGDLDYVKDVLYSMGIKEMFWKVAIRPGKPVLFGVLDKTLVFGLPGNPVSAMVTFEQFVLPAIYRMQGKKQKPWKEMWAVMEKNMEKRKGLFYFVRGKTSRRDGEVYVKPIGSQSSDAFGSMVLADCMILLPENASRIKEGEKVLIQMTGE